MILIIAEKPSLARNITAGIGKMKQNNGYFEGCGYIVSWAFGHLFSLADIEAYQPNPEGVGFWTMDNIPCFPEKFRFELRKDSGRKGDDGVLRQFRILESLCNRADVDTVVNAGDADREGEIIVRLCIEKALRTEKRRLRLWLPDQTPETVAAALSSMKSETEYENLANEGFARTYIDWLYGVNLTRYATLRTGTLLRVGRVIVPIVKAIYDRDMAIRNFKPDLYYALVSREKTGGETVELQSKQKFDRNQKQKAQALCDAYNEAGAVVTSVKQKKDTMAAGKLYSLSKLQNVLGKKYKMSMAESLEIVQKLYEEGYLTYPRTNSEYLATAEKDKIRKIIENAKNLGYPLTFKDSKTIFDDSKIESHSALTPTYRIPDKNRLTEREMQVYSTVFRRFAAVFCAEDCLVNRTEIRIRVGEYEEFTLKGTVMLEKGWTKYDDFNQKDKLLPPLRKGDRVEIRFVPTEKETSPPKHYTIETLNNYLKNPFRSDKAQAEENGGDEEEYRAIFEGLELGTEATRTGIIDNARKSEYIRLNKDVYTILPGGIYLIESLARLNISMDKYKTSQLGQALKKVFRGEIRVEDSVALARAEIEAVFQGQTASPEADTDIGFFKEEVGLCPLCGSRVIRSKFGYSCTGYREKGCRFSVNLSICGRTIPIAAVRRLLSEGTTGKLNGFISKNGKSFDAALRLENGRAVFDFPDRPTSAERLVPPVPPDKFRPDEGPAAAGKAFDKAFVK